MMDNSNNKHTEVTPELTDFSVRVAGTQQVEQPDGSVIRIRLLSLHVISDDPDINGALFCETVNGQQIPIILSTMGIQVEPPKSKLTLINGNKPLLLH